ncbi:MAG: SpoIID/LytB domain-containing protein [Lachnospiraceae bacterium]
MKKKNTGKKKHNIVWMILLVFVFLGIIGGVLVKLFFFPNSKEEMMPNGEANRLIRYLNLSEYEYSDRMGSSFSVEDARKLLEAANITYDQVHISLQYKPGFFSLSKKEFETLYNDLITLLELERLSCRDLYVYSIDNTNNEEIDGVVYEMIHTNEGDFYMEKEYGMDYSYENKVVQVYVSNNEIILCLGESEKAVTIYNGYATKVSNDTLYIYAGGTMKELPVYNKSEITNQLQVCLCDIVYSNKGVESLTDLTTKLEETKVTSCGNGILTLEGKENPVLLSENFYVYRVKGGFKVSQSPGTLIGYEKVSLYMKDNVVQAAVLTEDIYSKNIRVLIGTTDYTGYYHDKIFVSSETPFTISYGETVDEYEAGERVEFRNGSKELANGSAKIRSKNPDGKIILSGIERQCGSPAYRGTIELSKRDEGVVVINELPVEEYLYGVVPSEMPVSYNMEALKAQAICARAYAYRQMESDVYAEYGAHLDDSVASQVYNNVAEDDKAIYAVDDTYGVVPCYGDEVIEAFFFSTSCGTTSSNSVVWGGIQRPYLLDTMENELNDIANLSNEQSFQSFIDGKLGTGFFEENEPFYRWKIMFSKTQIENAINGHLYERVQAMPENILAKNAAGVYEKKAIKSVGEVQDILVTKRGKSGIIEELEIVGSEETVLVKGQNNIRILLSPEETTIYKQDGSTVAGWTSLPSAYFYVVNNGMGFSLFGGGFGHGVGMSQNGANDMAALGYTANDIIEHYYTAVELKDMYELMGK